MKILETERLLIREMDSTTDAEFILELLNTPKFIKYIGDRGVRTADDARELIDGRYRASYRDNGYGLYLVELRADTNTGSNRPAADPASTPDRPVAVGICGFVRRDTLPGPDLGFAFLPEHERKGYGFESAAAMMKYGRETLGFTKVFAITSLDNDASIQLLEKLGFKFEKLIENGEMLRLFTSDT